MSLHYDGEVRVFKVVMGPYSNNGYVIMCPTTKEAVIIDAPAEPEKLLTEVKESRAKVKAVLITHSHGDHLAGLETLRAGIKAPVRAHPADAPNIPAVDSPVQDSEVISVGTLNIQAIHTPGHTPGSLCYLVGNHLFTGDTLFPGGPGATRTPTHLSQIVQSITSRLLTLPNDTAVYPGHGADTTIGQSRGEYQVFAGKSHAPDLCGNVLWLSS